MGNELPFELAASAASVAAWAGLPHVPTYPGSSGREQALVLRQEEATSPLSLRWLSSRRLLSEDLFPADEGALARRCLIPATSCRILRKGRPYSFLLGDSDIFAIGAVWAQAPAGASDGTEYFSVISVAANPLLAPLFGEHPLIIDPVDYRAWLSPSSGKHLLGQLVKPLTAPQLKRWQLGPCFAHA